MKQVQFVSSITEVSRQQWQQLFNNSDPFCDYRFLSSLEQQGCVGCDSGWLVQHWLLFDKQQLIAAAPCYIKLHSYGEYLFDWGWAEAYQRHGLAYYPKLVCAVPFTPASGLRIGVADKVEIADCLAAMTDSLQQRGEQLGASNAQVLFPNQQQHQQLASQAWLQRRDIQYHWHNKDYRCFAEFTAQLTARKRKRIIKERRAVAAHNINIDTVEGDRLSQQQLQQFYRCYQQTYLKRSGHGGYLTLGFFQQLVNTMPEKIMLQLASLDNQVIAAALFFKSEQTLYGRYWGSLVEIDGLHFELCYYRGIDYCIEHQLQRFESGAQGEHKIARGFEPSYVYGNALLFDSPFSEAIDDFCRQEWQLMAQRFKQLEALSPFRKNQ